MVKLQQNIFWGEKKAKTTVTVLEHTVEGKDGIHPVVLTSLICRAVRPVGGLRAPRSLSVGVPGI